MATIEVSALQAGILQAILTLVNVPATAPVASAPAAVSNLPRFQ